MFMKTNLFFFPEIEISIRRRTLRRFRQGYRNIFPYKDYASPQVIMIKTENFQTTRQIENLLCAKKFHEKVKMGPFYVALYVIAAFISQIL